MKFKEYLKIAVLVPLIYTGAQAVDSSIQMHEALQQRNAIVHEQGEIERALVNKSDTLEQEIANVMVNIARDNPTISRSPYRTSMFVENMIRTRPELYGRRLLVEDWSQKEEARDSRQELAWDTPEFRRQDIHEQGSNNAVRDTLTSFFEEYDIGNLSENYQGTWEEMAEVYQRYGNLLVQYFNQAWQNETYTENFPFTDEFILNASVAKTIAPGDALIGAGANYLPGTRSIAIFAARSAEEFAEAVTHEFGHHTGIRCEAATEFFTEEILGREQPSFPAREFDYYTNFDRALADRIGRPAYWSAVHENEFPQVWDSEFGGIITHEELATLRWFRTASSLLDEFNESLDSPFRDDGQLYSTISMLFRSAIDESRNEGERQATIARLRETLDQIKPFFQELQKTDPGIVELRDWDISRGMLWSERDLDRHSEVAIWGFDRANENLIQLQVENESINQQLSESNESISQIREHGIRQTLKGGLATILALLSKMGIELGLKKREMKITGGIKGQKESDARKM